MTDRNLINRKGWIERPGSAHHSEKPRSLSRLILEHAISAVAVIDDHGSILYANEKMADLSGVPLNEIRSMDFRDLLDPARDPEPGDESSDTPSEIAFTGGDGLSRTAEVRVLPFITGSNERYRIISAVDITAHRRMAAKLAESERKYRLLVENIEEFFFEQSIEGGFDYFNEAMVRLSGFSREELSVFTFRDYILPEDWEKVTAFYDRILKTGEPGEGLLIRGRMKDGSVHYFSVKSNLKRDENGRKTGFRSYCRDVTAEILYEKEQLERERQFKALVEGSPIPTLAMDTTHTIVSWNKACEDLTGIRQDAVRNLVRPASRDFLKQPVLSDFLIDGRPLAEISRFYNAECRQSPVVRDAYEVEAFFPGLGETGKWLSLTSVFLRDSEGRVSGAVESLIDITAKKRAETDMLRMHEALEAKVMERTRELRDINTALEVLLKKREDDKRSLEERVAFSIKELIAPHIELLKRTDLDSRQSMYLETLEQNFTEISAPFMEILSDSLRKLTPSEIQVITLIKQNKSSKQIADFLGVSPRTVEFHRDNIRKKLGIRNKKQSLRAHLLSDR